MPGPTRWRGDILNHAILTKNVTMKTLNERVKAVLNLINWTKDAHIADRAPETTDNNTQETSAFMRKLASEAVVLMKNENNILPLKKNKVVGVLSLNDLAVKLKTNLSDSNHRTRCEDGYLLWWWLCRTSRLLYRHTFR